MGAGIPWNCRLTAMLRTRLQTTESEAAFTRRVQRLQTVSNDQEANSGVNAKSRLSPRCLCFKLRSSKDVSENARRNYSRLVAERNS